MKKGNFPKLHVVFILCLLIAVVYCSYAGDCIPTAKYERTVRLSEPLPAGSLFEAQTNNGYINITGTDVAECSLTATIIAKAETEEIAQKLAEEVKVALISSDKKLTVKIEKPKLDPDKYVSVNLDVSVPNQTSTDLTTHNGALKIKSLTGQINCTTHNGEVTAEKLSGTAKFETHNGKIFCKEIADNTQIQTHNGLVVCEEVSGDIKLRTHNGNAKAFYSTAAPSVCIVSMVTHNGSVSLTAPPNFSAKVDVSTHNGSINTDLPITVTEKINKKKLTGTLGTGEGELYLETHNGSINIK
jgi:hypothetical protein